MGRVEGLKERGLVIPHTQPKKKKKKKKKKHLPTLCHISACVRSVWAGACLGGAAVLYV